MSLYRFFKSDKRTDDWGYPMDEIRKPPLGITAVVPFTDWDKELNLLSEYMEYFIHKKFEQLIAKQIFLDNFRNTGLVFINNSDPYNLTLTFEEWKYWILYRHEPWEFYNRYMMPTWAPLITKKEWDESIGFIVIKARQIKRYREYLPVSVRAPLLIAHFAIIN